MVGGQRLPDGLSALVVIMGAVGITNVGAGTRRGTEAAPWCDIKAKLRRAGLRPTRQRVALGSMLFGRGDRHVTAEMLFQEAAQANVRVSLATVYNTLHQFSGAGLLRQIVMDGPKVYFDTNITDHHHFLAEDEFALSDIPGAALRLEGMPIIPKGYEISRVDIVVRLRRKV
jgi:Fur family transcriptional regulator, iron response regulator